MLRRGTILRVLTRQCSRETARCLGPSRLLKVPLPLDRRSVLGGPSNCQLSTLRLDTRIERSFAPVLNFSRTYASKKGKKGAQKPAEPSDSEDSDEEDEKDPLEDDSDYEDVDDSSEPKDYKDITRVVPSVRLDAVLKAGLDTSRHKIEEEFYSNKIRVNGQKVLKKSISLKEGDMVDLIRTTQTEQERMMSVSRVVLLKTENRTTQSGNTYVQLRRWKALLIPNPKKRQGVTEQTDE
ncbi:mitochondrial transcription rescue factor 1-like [Branchiostoma floridae]|uniref:Mitochondrial transcription rescue factor 1-like n=1 Tax=Branchiostoma floridae TaxID=7739 RepID=A0A9J7LML6_BRAFL|nr:mitochondrial transcription rescue factor 1-like [Branchiostoma floridae]